MKVFASILAIVAIVSAEPPVPSNRYLPGIRSASIKSNFLSTSYGAPSGFSQEFTPSSQYGVPAQYTSSPTQYSAPSSSYGVPSSQYGVPSQFVSSKIINPSAQYGVPSQYSVPFKQYNSPSAPSTTYATPSTTYGTPSTAYGVPSSKYGVPSYSRANFEENSEPANYNFQYDVQEHQYGSDFGHAEARQGENAQGRYYVTLPDGRKQTVDYTADEHGFKPQISYQQSNNGYASKYSNGGYSNGGYSNAGYSNSGHSQNNYENGY